MEEKSNELEDIVSPIQNKTQRGKAMNKNEQSISKLQSFIVSSSQIHIPGRRGEIGKD